jgi:hypothetical protein
MAEAAETYQQPAHGWTCFHCGETFHTPGAAAQHFGARPDARPGCLVRVQVGEERGLQYALRTAEWERDILLVRLLARRLGADENKAAARWAAQLGELRRPHAARDLGSVAGEVSA